MENMVEKAEEIARKAHEGQFRKMGEDKGKPYIIHPERVAKDIESIVNSELHTVVAWLHDVVEDTDVTIKDLCAEGFPFEVIDAVKALTHTDRVSYLDYLVGLRQNEIARRVKMCDLRDNMRDLPKGARKDKYELAYFVLKAV